MTKQTDQLISLRNIQTIIKEWDKHTEQINNLDMCDDLEPIYGAALDRYNEIIMHRIKGELDEYD